MALWACCVPMGITQYNLNNPNCAILISNKWVPLIEQLSLWIWTLCDLHNSLVSRCCIRDVTFYTFITLNENQTHAIYRSTLLKSTLIDIAVKRHTAFKCLRKGTLGSKIEPLCVEVWRRKHTSHCMRGLGVLCKGKGFTTVNISSQGEHTHWRCVLRWRSGLFAVLLALCLARAW